MEPTLLAFLAVAGLLALALVRRAGPYCSEKKETPDAVAFREAVRHWKEREERLRESEEKFRSICSAVLDGIILIDDTGAITFWNEAAERIFGYKAEEVLGKNLHELLAPERFLPAHREKFPIFAQTGKGMAVGKTVELAAKHKNGTEFPIELSLAALQVRGAWHAVGIVRDITERKKLESELSDSRASLQEANRELENKTAEAQRLAQAAQAASEAKSAFLAAMSHEIRTPLNGVLGMIDALSNTELTPAQRDYLETMRMSAENLLLLINDILDISRIEAGQLTLNEADFSLRETLDSVNDTLAVKAQEKGLEYFCFVDPSVPDELRGDAARLRQILINLAGNAVKFTEKGEVRIEVSCLSGEGQNPQLSFTVSDTGPGIPPDKIDHIFDRFVQGDESLSRRHGGTGLGLAIVKNLVELMGGSISVKSEPGRGTIFHFTVVMKPAHCPAEQKRAKLPADFRVLFVDDNETNRKVLASQLAVLGCSFEEADSGPEALSKLKEAYRAGKPFSAVILDMAMPGMDGLALARCIRDDPDIAETPLILLTSLMEAPRAELYSSIDFHAILTKPVKHTQLRRCLMGLHTGNTSEQPTPKAEEAAAGLAGLKVLLVEDNLTNQKVAQILLSRYGINVETVSSGREALRLLAQKRYDAVLMDVQMPDLDGYETTAIIRDPESEVLDHHVPIIAMTAHALSGDREKCLKAGMDDYVSKPFKIQELLSALSRNSKRTAFQEESPVKKTEEDGQALPPVFDREGLLERLAGDEDMLLQVVETFLQDAERLVADLTATAQAPDAESLSKAAHALKGAAGSTGAMRLMHIAKQIEEPARKGQIQEAAKLAASLPEELDRFRKTFQAEVKPCRG